MSMRVSGVLRKKKDMEEARRSYVGVTSMTDIGRRIRCMVVVD